MTRTIVGFALGAGLALATAGAARAEIYSFVISGSGFSGSGLVTTDGAIPLANLYPCATCAATPGYLVTTISGTLNGEAITGPVAPGTIAGNNNRLYPSPGGPYLDWGDLGFTANGVNYNAFQGDYAGHSGYFLAASNLASIYNPISFELAAGVPEPATWAMLILGFGAIGATLRRRRPATTFA